MYIVDIADRTDVPLCCGKEGALVEGGKEAEWFRWWKRAVWRRRNSLGRRVAVKQKAVSGKVEPGSCLERKGESRRGGGGEVAFNCLRGSRGIVEKVRV